MSLGPRLGVLAVLLWLPAVAVIDAEELLTLRVHMAFPETMMTLQSIIKQHGHTLSRIQRVDKGLKKSGYESDKYRVVFFGRRQEIQRWSKLYPELIPFLPYKIVIYADDQDTMLVAANPRQLFPAAKDKLRRVLNRWHGDLQAIFQDMKKE